jgi:phosphoribosylcarboxyaminoimidazole (NCAIR) mutase
MLALSDESLSKKLEKMKETMAQEVSAKDAAIQEKAAAL